MPFDGNLPPLMKRRMLIDALRAEMPENFVWDFGVVKEQRGCGTAGCALGLAIKMGLIGDYGVGLREKVAAAFAITAQQVDIFTYSHYFPLGRKITPAMVADALEALEVSDAV